MLCVHLLYHVLETYLQDLLKNYSMYQIKSVGKGFKCSVLVSLLRIMVFPCKSNCYQFNLGLGGLLWPFIKFSLLLCLFFLVMLAFFSSSLANMDFFHIYESCSMLHFLWWVIFVTSIVFMMSLWEQRRPETWSKRWVVLNSTIVPVN